MKIGVFFHDYLPLHETKDPGQIVLGLGDLGVDVDLVTIAKKELENYSNIPIRLISNAQSHSAQYWASTKYDIVIGYTWLRDEFMWIPGTLKRAGKKVIVKGDTDGRIVFPLHPRWDCVAGNALGIIAKLKIVRRRLKRRLNKGRNRGRLIEHLKVADAAVVETPQAFSNIGYILAGFEGSDLLRKVEIIPNPVASDVIALTFGQKKDQLVAIGNWEIKFGDYLVKNTEVMCRVVVEFLSRHPHYKATLIGQGETLLKKMVAGAEGGIRSRIRITGQIIHGEVVRCLAEAKIIFIPSISESFGIAPSEGVCMGCSIVGSPLESLEYLTNGGYSGTLAAAFRDEAYLGALNADAVRWERGDYSAERIAIFWRRELCRREVSGKYVRVIEQLINGRQ